MTQIEESTTCAVERVTMPPEKGMEKEISALEENANKISIVTEDDYKSAAEILKLVKDRQRAIKDHYKGFKVPAKALYDKIRDQEKVDLLATETIERAIKGKLGEYVREKEREQAEERRKLEAANKKREEDRREAEALALEAAGRNEEAEKVIEKPIQMAPVVQRRAVPKVSGVMNKKIISYTITDADSIPREYCVPAPGLIQAEVRKSGMNTVIPGVLVEEKMSFSG